MSAPGPACGAVPCVLVAELGDLQLWRGSAERLDFLADGTVSAIVLSPPYNQGKRKINVTRVVGVPEIGQARLVSRSQQGGTGQHTRQQSVERYDSWDDGLPERVYQDWQVQCLAEWARVCRDGASLFYQHRPRVRAGRLLEPLDWLRRGEAYGWVVRQQLIWDRGTGRNHEATLFVDRHELLYWLTKGPPQPVPQVSRVSTVLELPRVAGQDSKAGWHPAPFPVELPLYCLSGLGLRRGDLVLDPCCGSGTTLMAAALLGLRGVGVDISARYLGRAAQRLSQLVLPLSGAGGA